MFLYVLELFVLQAAEKVAIVFVIYLARKTEDFTEKMQLLFSIKINIKKITVNILKKYLTILSKVLLLFKNTTFQTYFF